MTRRYKLLKDIQTPQWDIKAGSVFVKKIDSQDGSYVFGNYVSHPSYVEGNENWFRLIPEEVKVDWEIVSFKHKDDSTSVISLSEDKSCYYWPTYPNLNPWLLKDIISSVSFIIHSVRRLSDNTTFSIGDEVEYTHQLIDKKHTFIISAIGTANENDCVVWKANPSSYLRGIPECSISSLRKVKDDSKPTSTKPEQEPNDIANVLIDKYGGNGVKRVFYDVNPCPICGGQQVLIRGRNPGEDKRPACATCSTERLEQINQISDRHYGKACKQG